MNVEFGDFWPPQVSPKGQELKFHTIIEQELKDYPRGQTSVT